MIWFDSSIRRSRAEESSVHHHACMRIILVPEGLFTFGPTPEAAYCPGWKQAMAHDVNQKTPRQQCEFEAAHACKSLSLLDVQRNRLTLSLPIMTGEP